jgi:hypothetical protein
MSSMEISLSDIEKSFQTVGDGNEPSFANYFNSWNEESIEAIFTDKVKNKNSHHIWQDIAQIIHEISGDNFDKKEQGYKDLAQIINFLKIHLKRAFDNNDLKPLFVFLSINCYIEIPLRLFIDQLVVEKQKILDLLIQAEIIIQNCHSNLNAPDNAPYYEKEYLRKYNEGIDEDNIEKVYSLIDALENGKGIYLGYLLENLLKFIHELDKPLFVKCLNSKDKPHDFVFATQWIKKKDLVALCNDFSFSNKWLLFELIRQINESNEKAEIDNEIQAIANCLKQVFDYSNYFYYQSLKYFNRQINFHKGLGLHLSTLNFSQIKFIVDECFIINRYDFNLEAKTSLLNSFEESTNDFKTDFLLELVFVKWNSFFEEGKASDDFHAFDIITTDFANFVLHYLIKRLEREEIISKIIFFADSLNNINVEWHKSPTKRYASFFINLSKLNIYCYAYRNVFAKEDGIEELTNVETLFSNEIFQNTYFKKANEEVMNAMKTNLGIVKEFNDASLL